MKNVVSSSEFMFRGTLKKGSEVKMFYEKKWYSGKVILTECDINISDEHNSDHLHVPTKEMNTLVVDVVSDSSNNVPLAQIRAKLCDFSSHQKIAVPEVPDNESEMSEEPVYDSDADPPYIAT